MRETWNNRTCRDNGGRAKGTHGILRSGLSGTQFQHTQVPDKGVNVSYKILSLANNNFIYLHIGEEVLRYLLTII